MIGKETEGFGNGLGVLFLGSHINLCCYSIVQSMGVVKHYL